MKVLWLLLNIVIGIPKVVLIFSGTRNNEVMQMIGLFVAFVFKVIATLLDIRKYLMLV